MAAYLQSSLSVRLKRLTRLTGLFAGLLLSAQVGNAAPALEPGPAQPLKGIGGAEGGPGYQAVADPGFNLQPRDLIFSASPDPDLKALIKGAMGPDGEVRLEQAFLERPLRPSGVRWKAGRFYSDIGYPHREHPAQWGYTQGHVPYGFLKKPFHLRDTGLQLTWKAEASYHLRLGVEAFQGESGQLNRFDGKEVLAGAGLGRQAVGRYGEASDGPRLYTAFAEAAPPLGGPHRLQGSVFGILDSDRQELRYAGSPELQQGSYWMAGTSWVYSRNTPTAFGDGRLKLSAEYLHAEKDLEVAYHADEPGLVGEDRRRTEEAYSLQARYGFSPEVNADVRFDLVGLVSGLRTEGRDQTATHLALESTWSPTEHSTLRARLTRDAGERPGPRSSESRFMLRYSLDLGHFGGDFL
ncbi:hypothetical protein AN478_11195 [Thiohalorhabdus denitrificans]|uniref:Uncharacterized protein n=1 Tax=Thiohalorhabdus denitrificans TaxID=381306 RepID=A0A0P9EBN5_9GAMM|nr:hypothetical protein [Thiohalorhabdus denitrificans]KPV39675.1 hypothetical protein AN478_11195 [Thiohalorhabdus denitrificans]SCX94460.1 hypothetical protein SAMN05661077_0794 [Thiohalorhabdus denitrificans]